MKLRIMWFIGVVLLAMPAVDALAATMVFDNYDPFTDSRQFTVFNDFDPVFEWIDDPNDPGGPQIEVVTFRKIIAFVVGLDDHFESVDTDRQFWKADLLDATEWSTFTFENGTYSAVGQFGTFNEVLNSDPNGPVYSRGGMYYDNDGPQFSTNNHIDAGESGELFFARGQFYNAGDPSTGGDFQVSFTPASSPAATLIDKTSFSGDTDGDGVEDPGETWTVEVSTTIIDTSSTVIPLPPAGWMGLGLLGILAFRRRLRRG